MPSHIKCTRISSSYWAAALWIGGVCELWGEGSSQIEALDDVIRQMHNEYKPGPSCCLAF